MESQGVSFKTKLNEKKEQAEERCPMIQDFVHSDCFLNYVLFYVIANSETHLLHKG